MKEIIGYIVETLRIKNNLTHSELSKKLSLPRRQIIEIENNTVEPSRELLENMSNIFKFDILTVIDYHEDLPNETSYRQYVDIRLAIYHLDTRKLGMLVEEVRDNIDFKTGENFQLMCHAIALLAIEVEKDYEKAIEVCEKGIGFLHEVNYEKLGHMRLTNYTYSLLISLTVCYDALGDNDMCKLIADNALNSIKKYAFSDAEPLVKNKHILQKCYVMLLNNASHFYFALKDYNTTLELIEEGIIKCKEFDLYDILTYCLHLKFETLYCLGKYEEAQENYNLLKTISTITSYGKLQINALKVIKEKYPKIVA